VYAPGSPDTLTPCTFAATVCPLGELAAAGGAGVSPSAAGCVVVVDSEDEQVAPVNNSHVAMSTRMLRR
jgi:hypothetical protein